MKQIEVNKIKRKRGCLKALFIVIALYLAWHVFLMIYYISNTLANILLLAVFAFVGYRIYKAIKPGEKRSKSDKNNPYQISINGGTIIENPFAGVFISGGAGSGKSKSLVEPIIKQAGQKGYTGVIYDFKFPELAEYANTAYEQSDIKQYYINFTDLNKSNRINPIAPELMRNESYAREFAFTILANLNPQMISKPDFWSDNATSLLTAVFWYLKQNHPQYCTLPHAISMILQPDLKALLHTLATNAQCADMIAPILTSYAQGADNQTAGVMSSLQVSLSKINSTEIYYLLSKNEVDLRLNDQDKKGVLVVGNDPTLASTYAPIIGLILTSVSKQLNRQDKEKSLFLMDEFPTIYVPNIEQLPATARSNKVATILACQDISQMTDKYGREKTDTILSNLGNQFYGRTPNIQTAQRVSQLFGRADKTVVSHNDDVGLFFETSKGKTYSTRESDIVKVQDVAQLNTGSFYTILSEGKNRQGLSTISIDNKFVKTPIMDIRGVSDYELQRTFENVKHEVKNILKS